MMRVAYQGEPGAFGEEAALLDAGHHAVLLPMYTFEEVVSAVMEGAADHGILPVSNSIIGPVRPGAAAAATPGLAVLRRIALPVRQCLLAQPGTRIAQIERVISHPAALSQCSTFLAGQPHITAVEWYDTAGAAKHVATDGDTRTAAIASRRAAERYGLQILAMDIQDRHDNITEFVVISR